MRCMGRVGGVRVVRTRVMRVMRNVAAVGVVRIVARRRRRVLAHPQRQQREGDCASMLTFAWRHSGSSNPRRRAQGNRSYRRAQRKYRRPSHARKPAGVTSASIRPAKDIPTRACCADSAGRARGHSAAPNAPGACPSTRGRRTSKCLTTRIARSSCRSGLLLVIWSHPGAMSAASVTQPHDHARIPELWRLRL